MLRILIVSFS